MTGMEIHRHLSGGAKPFLHSTIVICMHIPSCRAGSPLTLVSPTSAPLALAASLFPTLHQPRTLTLLLRNAWWRCVMPNEFLVTSLPLGWQRLLEELQRHLHVPWLQSASLVPTHFTGFPLPACYPRLCCPSSLHLRQSFLKLLNMANCVRREAHFI